MVKVRHTVLHSRPVKSAIGFLQRKKFPGHPQISWYSVIEFFIRWVDRKDVHLRASSLSYTFFLAMFPSVIFIFTLFAYLPFGTSHNDILRFFDDLLPDNVYRSVKSTLEDILHKQRGGLLSLGFVTAVYFSTNGFVSLMKALNKYGKKRETRSFWKQRLVAIILALIVSVSLLVSVLLITLGNYLIRFFDKLEYFPSRITPVLLSLLNYGIVAAIILTFISAIYYLAPNSVRNYRFFSTGSIFASATIMLTMICFSAYVNQFNSYNKVYGSIGVIIVVMLLIYINTYILLLGYELNVAIEKVIGELESKGGNIRANKVVYLKAKAEREKNED